MRTTFCWKDEGGKDEREQEGFITPLEAGGEMLSQAGRFSRLSHATVPRFNADNNHHTKYKNNYKDHRIHNLMCTARLTQL